MVKPAPHPGVTLAKFEIRKSVKEDLNTKICASLRRTQVNASIRLVKICVSTCTLRNIFYLYVLNFIKYIYYKLSIFRKIYVEIHHNIQFDCLFV